MAFAVNITARGAAGARLKALWDIFSVFETAPSMASLKYPPHVTLAVYPEIGERRLRDAMHAVFDDLPPVRLRFGRLAAFEQPRLVLWAEPDSSEALAAAHAHLHRLIDPALCHEHYRPAAWLPHCTLATAVTSGYKEHALALAAHPLTAFDVAFGHAEACEFPPVRILDAVPLKQRP
jgi:2'-5' RNA ligase